MLAAFLAERNVPCPRCGYNLRGLVSDGCPECGDRLQLQVGLVEPRLGPYLAAVVACCAGAAASGFIIVLALAYAPGSWWGQVSSWIATAQFLTLTPTAVALLKWRRAFTRQTHERQMTWAICASLVAVIATTGVIVTFRG